MLDPTPTTLDGQRGIWERVTGGAWSLDESGQQVQSDRRRDQQGGRR